jgi:hypothetical protein
MATYTLINSNVLASTTASVTFSAIPATYTDLVLRCSMRLDEASTTATVKVWFNSDTANNYSLTFLRGSGSAAASNRTSSSPYFSTGQANGNSATANIFTSAELYIPSYAASQNKPFSSISAHENNTSTAYIESRAGLWSNTAAMTSISLQPIDVGISFLSGSSFYLYGISNA